MSLFGAVRLYVVSANRIERDLAPPDDGYVPASGDGAWALWARMGDSGGEMDHLPPASRVQLEPVHIGRVQFAHGQSDPV